MSEPEDGQVTPAQELMIEVLVEIRDHVHATRKHAQATQVSAQTTANYVAILMWITILGILLPIGWAIVAGTAAVR